MKKEVVVIGNLKIGEGTPKICVPLIGTSAEELLEEVRELDLEHADLVEWRADYFEDLDRKDAVILAAKQLRSVLDQAGKPMIFTVRRKAEGGMADISLSWYMELNKAVMLSGAVEMIDIEYSVGDELASELLWVAKKYNVITILSSHDFEKTPRRILMMERLHNMQILGGDILKLAVTPLEPNDVLTLMQVSNEMSRYYARGPIVTMSMGELGLISRLAGEVFGSAITFASGRQASAPGQIPAGKLAGCLDVMKLAPGEES